TAWKQMVPICGLGRERVRGPSLTFEEMLKGAIPMAAECYAKTFGVKIYIFDNWEDVMKRKETYNGYRGNFMRYSSLFAIILASGYSSAVLAQTSQDNDQEDAQELPSSGEERVTSEIIVTG